MAQSVIGRFVGNAILKTAKGAGSALLHSDVMFSTLPLPYERGWTRRAIAAPVKGAVNVWSSAMAAAERQQMMKQAHMNIRAGMGAHLTEQGVAPGEIKRQVNDAIGFLSGDTTSASVFGSTFSTEAERRDLSKRIRGIVIDEYKKSAPYTYSRGEMRVMNRLMARDDVSPGLRQRYQNTLLGDESVYQSFLPGGYNRPIPGKEMYESLYADYGHDAIEEEMLRLKRFKNRPSKTITKGVAFGAVSATVSGAVALGGYGAFGGAYRADTQRRLMFGPDPYVAYPGTTNPPPDLGADGDLVFALHNGRRR